MITIYYHQEDVEVKTWTERLDKLFFKYILVQQNESGLPVLVDDEQELKGIKAIENHLDDLEKFVQGWYEDRCDRYEFLDEKPSDKADTAPSVDQ